MAFDYNSKRGMQENPSMSMDEFPKIKAELKFLKYLLQKAALADQKELHTSLDNWIQNHSCGTKECGTPLNEHETEDTPMCLAAQISAI